MFANNWTGTNTGKKINLTKPDLDAIDIKDIANALSKVCRFNGHLKAFYSVAQHAIHVAELVPKHLKLQALLHDASEAYICDVPTPLKRMLGKAYEDVEVVLQSAIGEKFGVDLVDLDPLVKQADRIMVVSERDAFQQNPLKWSDEYENVLRYPGNLQAMSMSTAHDRFLEAFKKYYAKQEPKPDPASIQAKSAQPVEFGIANGGGRWSTTLKKWVYPGEFGYQV